MTKYSKFNVIYRLQKWLDSVPGQTFMNYAYSWGASIVILGALFKLTHLPGANFWLFLGMGTEVFVFFIAGFDRPFDKTEDGKDLPTHVKLDGVEGEGVEPAEGEGVEAIGGGEGAEGMPTAAVYGGGGFIVGGEGAGKYAGHPTEGGEGYAGGEGYVGGVGGVGGEGYVGGVGGVGGGGAGGTIIIGGGGGGGTAGEGGVSGEPVEGGQPIVGGQPGIVGGVIGGIPTPELPDIDAEDMEEATTNYVEKLKNLTEILEKVAEQSERLTRDSEEMENLNRTLTGICKVYEMQLKGASQQIGTIDEINEQTRKMAGQIAELNRIYARMIEAMTTNMPNVAPQS